MPGILLHLHFAQLVGEKLNIQDNNFYVANLIPDFVSQKSNTHFYTPLSKHFSIPDLKKASEILNIYNTLPLEQNLHNPNYIVRLGIYSHLYLDYHFIKDYLYPIFKDCYLNTSNNSNLLNTDNLKQEQLNLINMIHNTYSVFNHRLLNEKVITKEFINILPENLPYSDIKEFDDNRIKQTWKHQLKTYLKEQNYNQTSIIDYTETLHFFDEISNEFISHLLSSKNKRNET